MAKRKKKSEPLVELTETQCLNLTTFGVNLMAQVRSQNDQISLSVLNVNEAAVKYQAVVPGKGSYNIIIPWGAINHGDVTAIAEGIISYFQEA